MTNGGSKGSKSEKQVEGDTDLSWDHEGLEPHPEPSKPKPPRSLKPSRVLGQGQRMNRPLLKYALGVGEIMMKRIVQNSYIRKKERRLYPPTSETKPPNR